MKKKRNEKLNKAEKLGIKELIKYIFFIALFIFIVLLIMFKYAAEFDNVTLLTYLFSHIYFTLAILLSCIAIIIFLYFTCKEQFIDDAYKKLIKEYSKQLVEKLLVPGEPTKVTLINTRNSYNKYFILSLQEQNICEFYAVLQENNSIAIFSKFDKNDDILFDTFQKEDFTTYCEISDNV